MIVVTAINTTIISLTFNSSCFLWAKAIIVFCSWAENTGSRAGAPSPFFCSLAMIFVFSLRPIKSLNSFPLSSCLPAHQSCVESSSKTCWPACGSTDYDGDLVCTCTCMCMSYMLYCITLDLTHPAELPGGLVGKAHGQTRPLHVPRQFRQFNGLLFALDMYIHALAVSLFPRLSTFAHIHTYNNLQYMYVCLTCVPDKSSFPSNSRRIGSCGGSPMG